MRYAPTSFSSLDGRKGSKRRSRRQGRQPSWPGTNSSIQDNAGYTMGLPHMYPAFFVDGHSHLYPAKLRWRPKTPPAKLRWPANRLRPLVTEDVRSLDVFEVTVGADLQLVAGGFVADDDAVRMELQGGDGPHLVHAALHGLLQRTRLGVTVG